MGFVFTATQLKNNKPLSDKGNLAIPDSKRLSVSRNQEVKPLTLRNRIFLKSLSSFYKK